MRCGQDGAPVLGRHGRHFRARFGAYDPFREAFPLEAVGRDTRKLRVADDLDRGVSDVRDLHPVAVHVLEPLVRDDPVAGGMSTGR